MKALRKSIFLCLEKNQLKFCRKTCWKEQPFIFCLFDKPPFSNICSFWNGTMKSVELNWLCKHMKNVRSSQASISINSFTELSKMQFSTLLQKNTYSLRFHFKFSRKNIDSTEKWYRVIFKIALHSEIGYIFKWKLLEILNVFITLTLKQVFWKMKTFFEKLEYRFLVESTNRKHNTSIHNYFVKSQF